MGRGRILLACAALALGVGVSHATAAGAQSAGGTLDPLCAVVGGGEPETQADGTRRCSSEGNRVSAFLDEIQARVHLAQTRDVFAMLTESTPVPVSGVGDEAYIGSFKTTGIEVVIFRVGRYVVELLESPAVDGDARTEAARVAAAVANLPIASASDMDTRTSRQSTGQSPSPGVARAATVVCVVFTLAVLVVTLLKAKRDIAIRRIFDGARLLVSVAALVGMASVTKVTTSPAAGMTALTIGAVIGYAQGRALKLRVEPSGRLMGTRTTLGLVVWGGGLVVMQVAGLVSRSTGVHAGQSLTLMSIAVTAGLIVGRMEPTKRAQMARVAVVAGLTLLLLAAPDPQPRRVSAAPGDPADLCRFMPSWEGSPGHMERSGEDVNCEARSGNALLQVARGAEVQRQMTRLRGVCNENDGARPVDFGDDGYECHAPSTLQEEPDYVAFVRTDLTFVVGIAPLAFEPTMRSLVRSAVANIEAEDAAAGSSATSVSEPPPAEAAPPVASAGEDDVGSATPTVDDPLLTRPEENQLIATLNDFFDEEVFEGDGEVSPEEGLAQAIGGLVASALIGLITWGEASTAIADLLRRNRARTAPASNLPPPHPDAENIVVVETPLDSASATEPSAGPAPVTVGPPDFLPPPERIEDPPDPSEPPPLPPLGRGVEALDDIPTTPLGRAEADAIVETEDASTESQPPSENWSTRPAPLTPEEMVIDQLTDMAIALAGNPEILIRIVAASATKGLSEPVIIAAKAALAALEVIENGGTDEAARQVAGWVIATEGAGVMVGVAIDDMVRAASGVDDAARAAQAADDLGPPSASPFDPRSPQSAGLPLTASRPGPLPKDLDPTSPTFLQDAPSGTVIPREAMPATGLSDAQATALSRITQEEGIFVGGRTLNAWGRGREGVPKPEFLKTKTITPDDVAIGFDEQHLGRTGYAPENFPLRKPPEGHPRYAELLKRYDERVAERAAHGTDYDELARRGVIEVRDGRVVAGSNFDDYLRSRGSGAVPPPGGSAGKEILPDIDAVYIRDARNPGYLSGEKYERVLGRLQREAGLQHGAEANQIADTTMRRPGNVDDAIALDRKLNAKHIEGEVTFEAGPDGLFRVVHLEGGIPALEIP